MASLFIAFEPLTGQRIVEVRDRRTKVDYAHFLSKVAQHYPNATQIRLVQDNLNTHNPSSFYQTFEASQALELTQLFDMCYTPKSASWLNMVEIELSVLARQCLSRRIGQVSELQRQVNAWVEARNRKKVRVNWQFTLNHARNKFNVFIITHNHNLTDRALEADVELNYKLEETLDVVVSEEEKPLTRSHGDDLQLNLFEPVYEGEFNNLEKDFVIHLDQKKAIQWWHRVAAKQGYFLQGWRRERVYPDFVACVQHHKNGPQRIHVLETKGLQLRGNPDTEYKQELLKLWKPLIGMPAYMEKWMLSTTQTKQCLLQCYLRTHGKLNSTKQWQIAID